MSSSRHAARFVFTDYVRTLERGGEPAPERFRALWEALRTALVFELRKRSLWGAPPSYLGICGQTSWADEDALHELLVDCYAFVFIERREGLEAFLEAQGNIEGLVYRSIRNFLYDVQKRNDPIGFRVFEALRRAARSAVAGGTLHVLSGDPKIRNETVLGFAPWYDPGGVRGGDDLAIEVRSWNDELLPELLTARGAARDEVVGKLAVRLKGLGERSVELFRFKDIVDPLKQDVRCRWTAVFHHSEGETGLEESDEDLVRLVRLVRPDCGFEERQAFGKLLACVSRALTRLGDVTEKTRDYLDRLWVFVRTRVVEEHEDKLPARQKIGGVLGIPRYRIPELLETLGREVERCRGEDAGGEEEETP